jgi:hypothetical protein
MHPLFSKKCMLIIFEFDFAESAANGGRRTQDNLKFYKMQKTLTKQTILLTNK